MPIEVTMPRLSDTMEQGTIVTWNVKEGDEVSAGDVLGDIETDKATMELQSFDDGVVAAILLGEGETVDVGSPILVLAEDGEDVAEVKASAGSGASSSGAKSEGGSDSGSSSESATAVAEEPEAAPATNGAAPSSNGDGGRIFASPLAKKVAAERNVDLSTLTGTGPSGRIVVKDVENAPAGGTSAPASRPSAPAMAPMPAAGATLESKTEQLTNMRATIAKRLVESKQTIPHYQVTINARMDNLMALRTQLNEQLEPQGVKLSVNDFLVRACALSMHQHPATNASWGSDGKSIDYHANVNIGVAIALPAERGGGLVVATLRDADRMGLRQISSDTKALAKKARDKGLSIDEMADATFTISNLGMYGVDHFTAIINPPNVAILAVGAAIRKPVVLDDGTLGVGHEMSMTMSSDHRVIDGAMAAQYLQTVKGYLENPASILV
ncbi:MAG: pyruvate dehydrogenase complex dihydrolipoamide acetyltransferase [Phycisphaerales bacterium]